ncbi:hypothetical protein PoHVEF18_008280 [Penicillium ochrochloron]
MRKTTQSEDEFNEEVQDVAKRNPRAMQLLDSVQVRQAHVGTGRSGITLLKGITIPRRFSYLTRTSKSNLDLILRCYNTEELVIAGVATSGAVLSTIRYASDLDYRITVLRDLCMDHDEEVHNILMDKVFHRKTDVTTGEEWIDRINAAATA